MTKHILCVVVLAMSLVGCKETQDAPPLEKEAYSASSDRVVPVEVVELSTIIPAMCNDYGIEIEEATEDPKRSQWRCKPLAGVEIRFEAVALIKGTSLVKVSAQGEKQVAEALFSQVWNGLRSRVGDYDRAKRARESTK
jgi:hypothetical protein